MNIELVCKKCGSTLVLEKDQSPYDLPRVLVVLCGRCFDELTYLTKANGVVVNAAMKPRGLS